MPLFLRYKIQNLVQHHFQRILRLINGLRFVIRGRKGDILPASQFPRNAHERCYNLEINALKCARIGIFFVEHGKKAIQFLPGNLTVGNQTGVFERRRIAIAMGARSQRRETIGVQQSVPSRFQTHIHQPAHLCVLLIHIFPFIKRPPHRNRYGLLR